MRNSGVVLDRVLFGGSAVLNVTWIDDFASPL